MWIKSFAHNNVRVSASNSATRLARRQNKETSSVVFFGVSFAQPTFEQSSPTSRARCSNLSTVFCYLALIGARLRSSPQHPLISQIILCRDMPRLQHSKWFNHFKMGLDHFLLGSQSPCGARFLQVSFCGSVCVLSPLRRGLRKTRRASQGKLVLDPKCPDGKSHIGRSNGSTKTVTVCRIGCHDGFG